MRGSFLAALTPAENGHADVDVLAWPENGNANVVVSSRFGALKRPVLRHQIRSGTFCVMNDTHVRD